MLAHSLDEALAHKDWFADSDSPPILVLDDFYDDPQAIRSLALSCPFVAYVPPDPAIVGAEIGAANAHRRGRWMSSALVAYHGRPARNPFFGERFNPDWVRDKLEAAIGEPVSRNSWPYAGDHWNGAFHLVDENYAVGDGFIHHHYKAGDLAGRGWSAVVFLSPDPPETAGTSIWLRRSTGRCTALFGEAYEQDPGAFDLALLIENRFNRIILFRENVWHRLEHGFGQGMDARLTQTFFFETAA